MDLAEATKEEAWQEDKISPSLLQEKHHKKKKKKNYS